MAGEKKQGESGRLAIGANEKGEGPEQKNKKNANGGSKKPEWKGQHSNQERASGGVGKKQASLSIDAGPLKRGNFVKKGPTQPCGCGIKAGKTRSLRGTKRWDGNTRFLPRETQGHEGPIAKNTTRGWGRKVEGRYDKGGFGRSIRVRNGVKYARKSLRKKKKKTGGPVESKKIGFGPKGKQKPGTWNGLK